MDNEKMSTSDDSKFSLKHYLKQIEHEYDKILVENAELKKRVVEYEKIIKQLSKESPNIQSPKLQSKMINFSKVKELGNVFKTKLSMDSKQGSKQEKTKIIRHYRYHNDAVWDVTTIPLYSEKTNLIASASADGTVCIWNEELPNPIMMYTAHLGSVNQVRFHPTNPIACSVSGDKTCHLWEFKLNETTIESLHSPPKSSRLMTRLSYIKHFEPSSMRGSDEDVDDEVEEEIATQDMLSESEVIGEITEAKSIPSIESNSGNAPKHITFPISELLHTHVVSGCDFIFDGLHFVTSCWDGHARLYNVENYKLISEFGNTNPIHAISCAQQSSMFITCYNECISLWDTSQKEPVHIFKHSDFVGSAVFGSNDRFIISGSDDGIMKIWDVKNMKSPLKAVHTNSGINKIAVSNYHSHIAVGLNKRMCKIFDLSGTRLETLQDKKGHSLMVCGVCWSSDGNYVYTSSTDKDVIQWRHAVQ